MSKNKGFTFIEVLIVVAIIGILSSIILVGLGSFRNRGRDTRRIADLRETQNGLELYYTKYGYYPAATTWKDLSDTLIAAGIGINVIPKDPANDWDYGYCLSGTTNYVLGAWLEDGSNPNLSQYQTNTVFPCTPTLSGTPGDTAACSKLGAITNKYCVVF